MWRGSGFGYGGAAFIAVILILAGVYAARRKSRQSKVFGILLAALGLWVIVDMATGLPVDFLAPELVNGFGSSIINPFQVSFPFLIMAGAVLVVPQGIFSINLRHLLKRRK